MAQTRARDGPGLSWTACTAQQGEHHGHRRADADLGKHTAQQRHTGACNVMQRGRKRGSLHGPCGGTPPLASDTSSLTCMLCTAPARGCGPLSCPHKHSPRPGPAQHGPRSTARTAQHTRRAACTARSLEGAEEEDGDGGAEDEDGDERDGVEAAVADPFR